MGRPDTPKMSLATTDSLIWASSSSFSTRCFSAVLAATRSTWRVTSRRLADFRSWRREERAQHLPLGDLAQPDRIQRVGLGQPGQICLTSRAFTSQVSNPCASSR